ncbi:hypothetical protein Gohar_015226, partial [Gossypium harknessii]|nr:hypothetical protein [Gossypium harknessii]
MDESVGFAAVILDSYGHVLRSSTGRMEGLIEPLLAEAIAIRESLSWLKSLHLDRVVIESDCLMVVEALPVSYNINSLVTSFMIACGYDHLLHLCSSVGLVGMSIRRFILLLGWPYYIQTTLNDVPFSLMFNQFVYSDLTSLVHHKNEGPRIGCST